MSAVAPNLANEMAALHNFKSRPLPIGCRETDLPECFREFVRTVDDVSRFVRRFAEKNPELQNNKNTGVALSPSELVKKYYEFPFELYPFQVRTVDELAELPRSGTYLDPGLGKTGIATAMALYKALAQGAEYILVIVPPVLITNWLRFVMSIKDRETGPLTCTAYRGTPKQRKDLKLDADITVVGIQIFKQDYARFVQELGGKKVAVIVDEAHCLKNPGSANHRKVSEFVGDKDLMLLTGTPINSPIDAYGMVKLVSPGVYRNLHQFENIHVAERDFFGNVTRWGNLDLLKENLDLNSVRLMKENVIADMPPVTYQQMFYELEPEHLRLYRHLAEQHLLPLKDGGKIDATTIQALIHALGQIVCNWAHFAQDEHKVSNGFQLVDETLDELGGGKLVLFSRYRLTNRSCLSKFAAYNPVAVFGEVSAADRDKAIDRFVEDPTCRLFIGNDQSAAFGIDRLQHVCSTVMFLEPSMSVSAFTQAIARCHRIGQNLPVTVKLATALDTLQERQMKALLDKQDLVQFLTGGGLPSIREAMGLT